MSKCHYLQDLVLPEMNIDILIMYVRKSPDVTEFDLSF